MTNLSQWVSTTHQETKQRTCWTRLIWLHRSSGGQTEELHYVFLLYTLNSSMSTSADFSEMIIWRWQVLIGDSSTPRADVAPGHLFKTTSVTLSLMGVKTGVMLFLHTLSQINSDYFAVRNTCASFKLPSCGPTTHSAPPLPLPSPKCCEPLITWKKLAG